MVGWVRVSNFQKKCKENQQLCNLMCQLYYIFKLGAKLYDPGNS